MNFEDRNIFSQLNKPSCSSGSISPIKSLLTLSIDEIRSKFEPNTYDIKDYLNLLKNYSEKTFSDLARLSNHKESYLKEIFSFNKRRQLRLPNRDCIIGLCFAFELNLKESNLLLKAAGFNELYHRDLRDIIIIRSLLQRLNLSQVNILLTQYDLNKIGNLDSDEIY